MPRLANATGPHKTEAFQAAFGRAACHSNSCRNDERASGLIAGHEKLCQIRSASERIILPKIGIEGLSRCGLSTEASKVARTKQKLQTAYGVHVHNPDHAQCHRP